MKLALARIAARIERAIVLPRRRAVAIDPYVGYGIPDGVIVRGRVLASAPAAQATSPQNRWRNFRQMMGLFVTDEVAGATVAAEGVTSQSDEEGYFALTLPRGGRSGRFSVTVSCGDFETECPVVLTTSDAAFGVISDVDDTMMATAAYSLWRNIWTSMTGNALTRHVFPDAVALLAQLQQEGRNPVFFVSSSPWNFHGFLQAVFARTGLPQAPMFLRDYGISETQFITGTHGDHKGQAIDTILAAHPDLSFVLVGDTGQHDATVYRDAVVRHPGRIAHVVLRHAGPVDAADRAAAAKLAQAGVPLTMSADYIQAMDDLRHLTD